MMLLLAITMGCGWLAQAPPAPDTIRCNGVRVTVAEGRVVLEAPVLRWADGPSRIVGVVHVGEPRFYDAVTDALSQADAVLYEGLTVDGPAPARPPPPDLGPFGLVHQDDAMQPDARWVHADTTLSELRRAMAGAGLSRSTADEMMFDGDQDAFESLSAEASSPRLRALARLALVRTLATPAPFEGPDADAYWEGLIAHRNQVVAHAVTEQAGSWAVLYGADHAWDLAQRVRPGEIPSVRWNPVIEVGLADVGLGAVQIAQWFGDDVRLDEVVCRGG